MANRKPVSANPYTIPASAKVGIISDVDDTIMITQAPVPWKAAYNLLFLDPKKKASVPGMSVLFTRIADLFPGAPFFLSFDIALPMWRVRFATSSLTMVFPKARCAAARPRPEAQDLRTHRPPAQTLSLPNNLWPTSQT